MTNKPIPLRDDEAERILGQVKKEWKVLSLQFHSRLGKQLKLLMVAFASFNGVVEEVDADRSRLKVAVSIFGRATPVELEYTQSRKILINSKLHYIPNI